MTDDLQKATVLDEVEELGAKLEGEIHGCGRCALAALMEKFELVESENRDLILKAILPLSGGIAQTRNTCAAVLGGLMGIGMAYFEGERLEDADINDIMGAMAVGRDFYRKFEKEVGHVRCFDIREAGLGRCFDAVDPGEYQKFVEAGGYDLCSRTVGKAARIAGEYIIKIREDRRDQK